MTRERYLSNAELASFMRVVRERRHVNQARDHALFALVANSGLKLHEVRMLTRNDVHATARPPWIRVNRTKSPQGPDPLPRLFLHPQVAKVVRAWVDQLPSGSARLFPFTKRQSDRLFRWYASKAGISRTYKLYALRHSLGMRLWRHTGDLRLMQAILGHSRLKATSGYVHVSPERMREAHAKLGMVG